MSIQLSSKSAAGTYSLQNLVKNFCMDRLFVTNIEDKETLYKSAKDIELVRGEEPSNAQNDTDANLKRCDKQPV